MIILLGVFSSMVGEDPDASVAVSILSVALIAVVVFIVVMARMGNARNGGAKRVTAAGNGSAGKANYQRKRAGRVKSGTGVDQLQNTGDDFLARQRREEQRLYEMSDMAKLKRSHQQKCAADSVKRSHEMNCDAETVRRESR
ncbi:MAG: hypothetical protein Q4B67_05605 [Eubacteriales bacterium]|nr:hypothetical protein [Eubacteriales bacterium]